MVASLLLSTTASEYARIQHICTAERQRLAFQHSIPVGHRPHWHTTPRNCQPSATACPTNTTSIGQCDSEPNFVFIFTTTLVLIVLAIIFVNVFVPAPSTVACSSY
jgi:hypothetical protein